MIGRIIKNLASIALSAAATGIVAHHIYEGLTNGSKIRHVEVPIKSRKITKALHGYTFAFVSDVHEMDPAELRQIAGEISGKKPDLLLLGGDFSKDRRRSWISLKIMSEVDTVDGIYGIEGNHDITSDLYMGMKLNGITPLYNQGVEVRPDLFIGGARDYYDGKEDTIKALADAKKSDFTVLLTHHPDVTMKHDTKKVDIIIAGHVHAGEMAIFGYWAPMLSIKLPPPIGTSEYFNRFRSGWAKSRDDRPVYVSNGVGKHGSLRIYSPPEVIYFMLLSLED